MDALFLVVLSSALAVNSAGPSHSGLAAAQRATVLIDPFVAQRIDSWLAYYKNLHANPELSSHEKATARKIADGIE